jgi:hypothetical protein
MAEQAEQDRDIARVVSAAREQPLPPPVVTVERAEEWVESIRADRDR